MKQDFILNTKKDNVLRVSAYKSNDSSVSSCLIYVHGFKGFKDWGFVPFIADYFAQNGFFVITFNFSHNGVGASLTEFVELDKFANNTFSLEIEELDFIIDSYRNGFFRENENVKIGLIGHSRGGAVTILTASKRNDISAVALWASISKIDRYTDVQRKIWRKEGFIEVLNTRTNKLMKLGLPLLNDIEENIVGSLNIEKAIKNLNIPLLIVHGNDDTSVPIDEAQELYGWANKEKAQLFEIPEAGHTFGITHPFSGSNLQFELLLEETNKFFNNYIN